jgi:hypothetical protein
MPLNRIQRDALGAIAKNRTADRCVADSMPLNVNAARFSIDLDLFHDAEEAVQASAAADVAMLESAGFNIRWLRRLPLIQSVTIARGEEETKLEWVADSDYRFFPCVPDDVFGYTLHPVDLALNKVSAAAGRREIRDLVDCVTIHESILPLGSLIWASVEKTPGYTPEGLVDQIRRNLNHPRAEWSELDLVGEIGPEVIIPKLRGALDEAEEFVMQMPTAKAGLLFLENDRVVHPDPRRLDAYQTHAGSRRGHWPSSAEIGAAMLGWYKKPVAGDDANGD